MNRKQRYIPEWAHKERLSDMVWIGQNVEAFWRAAQQQYREQGRGAIVVDTTVQAASGGHPFFYYSQAQIIEMGDADTQRMIREYDPNIEIVVLLLKPRERLSVYRFLMI
jgi:hypothetical protein